MPTGEQIANHHYKGHVQTLAQTEDYQVNEYDIPLRANRKPQQRVQPQPQRQRPRQTAEDTMNGMPPTPQSVLRHRPIQSFGQGTLARGADGSLVFTQGGKKIIVQRGLPKELELPVASFDDELEEDEGVTTTAGKEVSEQPAPPVRRSRQAKGKPHFLLPVGIGMLVMIVLWVVFSNLISFIQFKLDEMTYGYPRTYQFNDVVGHNNDSEANPTHFLILNLNRRIEVIEIPALDESHAQITVVTTLLEPGSEFYPVTAVARDVNGDGKKDLVLTIRDAHFFLINTGTGFRLPKQNEHFTS